MTKNELEPISPVEAKGSTCRRESTEYHKHPRRIPLPLKHFIRWCNDAEGIEIRFRTEIRHGAISALKMDGHEGTEP